MNCRRKCDIAKIEELLQNKQNRNFLMFNKMFDTLDEPLLSRKLIKQFHYELKFGVFEERANGLVLF